MRNRLLLCVIVCVLDIAAAFLLFLWSAHAEFWAIFGVISGVIGACLIGFSYEIAEKILRCKARFSYRRDARTDFSPSEHLVRLLRVQGWIFCSLPVLFLLFGA